MRSATVSSKAVWLPKRRCHEPLSASLRGWLFDTSSLTGRLRQACSGTFQVQLLDQRWQRPRRDESAALGLPRHRRALVREVYLLCDGTRWVYARTVFPAAALRGSGSVLARLGAKPLGAVLFADPMVKRGEVQVTRLVLQRPGLNAPDGHPGLWARRSLFYLRRRPLLVTEVFLPAFYQMLEDDCP